MRVTRARRVAAPPEDVWRLMNDPERLPAWWPGVQRVEEATPATWTKVLRSPKGKTIRADYTRLEGQQPRRLVWRHEVAESPFERLLSESLLEFRLDGHGGGTRVEITARHKPRGFARFGWLQLRLAAGRQLDDALEGLQRVLGAA
jgi:uncharacterized protein YndB with AHSA1/START domain